MRYGIIIVSPLLLFALVFGLGLWLTAHEPRSPELLEAAGVPHVRPVASDHDAPVAASRAEHELVPVLQSRSASRVPRALEKPLRAVAPDINLCIPHSLERDLGPIDVAVRFTPIRGGAFAPDVLVSTSWNDPVIERCIVEVFDESTFMPEPDGQFEPAQFVFHFPDDAETGLLGMTVAR
ncbi:MAG: hypothetical protein MUC96_37405 [Myxococcaceae bacterium]|nr:hypothetical protein [Myxococcaceae bacterium]